MGRRRRRGRRARHPRLRLRLRADHRRAGGPTDLRDSAALALGPPVQDPDLREVVTRIVDEWIGAERTPRSCRPRRRAPSAAMRDWPGRADLRQLAALAEVDNLAVAVLAVAGVGRAWGDERHRGAGRGVLTENAGRSPRGAPSRPRGPVWPSSADCRAGAGPRRQRPDPAVRQLPTSPGARDAVPAVRRLAGVAVDRRQRGRRHRAIGRGAHGLGRGGGGHPTAAPPSRPAVQRRVPPTTASIIARAASGWRAEGARPRPPGTTSLTDSKGGDHRPTRSPPIIKRSESGWIPPCRGPAPHGVRAKLLTAGLRRSGTRRA